MGFLCVIKVSEFVTFIFRSDSKCIFFPVIRMGSTKLIIFGCGDDNDPISSKFKNREDFRTVAKKFDELKEYPENGFRNALNRQNARKELKIF